MRLLRRATTLLNLAIKVAALILVAGTTLLPPPVYAATSVLPGATCAADQVGQACGTSTGGITPSCRSFNGGVYCMYPGCTNGACGGTATCTTLNAGSASYQGCTPSESGTVTTTSKEAPKPGDLAPRLEVPVPTVHFGPLESSSENKAVGIPWIADYISGVYKYAVGAAAVVAAAVLMIGGFQYLTAGGDAGRVGAAKKRITNALVGLGLTACSYLLLYGLSNNLVQLKNIIVTQVVTQDFKFMANEVGFKDPDAAAQAALYGAAAPAVGSGSAITQSPQDGEDVSINGIDLSGATTAPQKLDRFCSNDAGSLTTYAEKIQALARVVLGFKAVCIDQKGCAYLRDGFTNLPSGKIANAIVDVPFALKSISNNGGSVGWSDQCQQMWDQMSKCYYNHSLCYDHKPVNTADLKAEEAAFKAKYGDVLPPHGSCYEVAFNAYKTIVDTAYQSHGIFGGDCGSTIVQMYSCAGGKVADPFNGVADNAGNYLSGSRAGKGPGGSDVVAFKAKDEQDLITQINQHGGLKFGDIFNIGSQNWQHNFIYTGGREDVPFAVFEMGGPGQDGSVGTLVNVGLSSPVGGMRIHPTSGQDPRDVVINYLRILEARLRAHGHSIYPIYVWRPYSYTPCTDRSQCDDGQNCLCSASDCLRSNGSCIVSSSSRYEKCSMANICHKVKAGYCLADQDCPKGTSCQHHSCK